MCHSIQSSKGNYFIEVEDYLLGLKSVAIDWFEEKPRLCQVYMRGPYEVLNQPSRSRVLLTCATPVMEQDVSLLLNTQASGKTHTITLPAGIHLFSLSEGLQVKVKPPQLAKHLDGAALLVAFKLRDIVMFDGEDISVRHCYILNPEKHQLNIKDPFWLQLYRDSWHFIQNFLSATE